MSLERKIAQLLMIAVDASELPKAEAPLAAGLGGVQLQRGYYSLEDTRRFTEKLRNSAQKAGAPPLLIAVDYEGGSVYVPTTLGLAELPTNMMLGAAGDENNTASLFYLAGRELRRAGINMVLGPVADVNTNPENPIIGVRAIGDSPDLVSRILAASLNGFRTGGIISAVKHFPGHGAAGQDSHKVLPEIPLTMEQLAKEHLPPFAKAVELNVPFVMTAHILVPALDPDEPATFSKPALTGLLREKMGFKGAVITDSLDMKAVTSRYPVHRAAALALNAGADMLLIGKGDFRGTVREISRQVKAGLVSESRVNEAYGRIYRAKKAAGLFKETPYPSPFDKAYVNIARTLAQEAVTVVSDKEGLLPLKDKTLKTAVIIFAPPRFAPNALALYRALALRGYAVEQSVFDINPGAKAAGKALATAAKADRLIIGSFQWAGSQNKNQKKTIKTLLAAGKPAVLLSLMSPYDLRNYPEAGTSLALYGMTAPGMEAAGGILSGDTPTLGRLPAERALPAAAAPGTGRRGP
ncbi:MAG: glycoside hydrolase family 3 N-terminal domain-containing protein [Elusimicrobiales bacterium]|nr:glycoside hydrolase family 3 N-terminal domain-containing protein [Elusimicrobiales bacterium]